MSKKGVITGGIAAAVVIAIVAAFVSQPNIETVNLDMERTHGEISTTMGSPILGNPDAEITIVEFGDYQCPNCYRWFQTTKPQIVENYIETGKAISSLWIYHFWEEILQKQQKQHIVLRTKESIGHIMIYYIIHSKELTVVGQIQNA